MKPMAPILAAVLFLAAVSTSPLAQADEKLELGRQVFLETSKPRCAVCHTLADAGTTAKVGPVLDQIRPTHERVYRAVKSGIGPMPPNKTLSEEEMDAVAHYVSTVTGGAAQ